MRVCLYQNLCCTVLKPRVLKFCLKMCRHAYIFYCMNLRASRDPHWFHVKGLEMSPLETAGLRLFVSTLRLLLRRPNAANRTPSGTTQHVTAGANHRAQHRELRWGRDRRPGTQLCWGSPKWERPISVRAWAPPSSLFSLPFTSRCHCFIFALWPL